MNQGHIMKVMLLIAKRRGITVHELEMEILTKAIEEICLREVSDISINLKEKRVNEANIYEPSDQEIEDALDDELDKSNGK